MARGEALCALGGFRRGNEWEREKMRRRGCVLEAGEFAALLSCSGTSSALVGRSGGAAGDVTGQPASSETRQG